MKRAKKMNERERERKGDMREMRARDKDRLKRRGAGWVG